MSDSKDSSSPNKENSQPIFETVTTDTEIRPEEVSPDLVTPDQVSSATPFDSTPPPPPVFHENKNKYIIIGGGALFFIIIFVFFLKLLLGGIKPSTKSVSLAYWGLWEDKEIMAPLIAQYESKHPNVKIDYQKMDPVDYREKLLARSKNGQGPDIFRFHNTWLPEITDLVSPLPSSVMTGAEFDQTFYPIHKTDLKVGENYYGLPLMIDGLVLICNDGLFKKAGIATFPTNWDEVITSVSKLTVKDSSNNIITSGIALGTATNVEHFSDIFGLMLVQNGGNIHHLETEAASGALESYRKFAEDPNKRYWDDTMPNSIAAFIQEKVGMIIAPSWELLTIKASNPDIKVKVVPIPVVPGGKPVSLSSYWVEGVSRYSKNQIEAWNFLKFLTEKENMTKLYELESKTRPFGEPYSRVDLAATLTQNDYVGPVIQQAKYFVTVPLISRTFDNGLNDQNATYILNAINATVQGTSYEEALKTAKQGIDQVLTQFKVQ